MRRIAQLDPYTLVFGLSLFAFVCWRAFLLDVPFYWDEAWVYAPAVMAMEANGVSLLPDAIDTALSRGHPLLFHATAGAWATVFGTTPLSLHAFALTLATALLLAVFSLGRWLVNAMVGLAAALLVLTSEPFLAQSGLLLPEILLALCVVSALYAYLRRRAWQYLAWASAALLTKEAAVVLVLGVIAWRFVRLIDGPADQRPSNVKWLAISAVPFLVGSLHFVVQYRMFGWVFFPEHMGLITWDLKDIAYKARVIYAALFEEQGRSLQVFAFAFLGVALWRAIGWLQKLAIMLVFVASVKMLWGRWPLPLVPEPLSTLFAFGILFFLFFLPLSRKEGERSEILPLIFLITIAGWAFSAMNFYTDRYLLILVPLLALALAYWLSTVLDKWRPWLYPLVMGICVVLQTTRIGVDGKIGDTRLSYLDAIEVDRAMVERCEHSGMHDALIAADFMQIAYMQDTTLGYLSDRRSFTRMTSMVAPDVVFAIINSSTPEYRIREVKNAGYSVIERFQKGLAWSELLRRGQ